MDAGKLTLRLVVGGLLSAHGLQKLRGWWGGPGLAGTEQMMASMGIRPAKQNAQAVAIVETAGGAAIALGVGTPLAAASLIATQAVAVQKVHGRNGLWITKGGFEYNAVLTAVLTALAADGPGRISFDALIGKSRWGLGWGVLALVGGVAGAAGVLQVAERSGASAGQAGEPGASKGSDSEGGSEPAAESADASI